MKYFAPLILENDIWITPMFIIFDAPLNLLKSAIIESCYSYIYLLADNLNLTADRKRIPSLLQDKDLGFKN